MDACEEVWRQVVEKGHNEEEVLDRREHVPELYEIEAHEDEKSL